MTRQVNPHRQLNDAETRAYAAGMEAKRRGETNPAEWMPPDLYSVWKMGWNRIGRRLHEPSVFRSRDHHTKTEGVHVLRTEVETLDQALDVIEIQQRGIKAAATKKANPPPGDWHIELTRHNSITAARRVLKKNNKDVAVEKEAASQVEQRTIDRIKKIIEMLVFSVEEMSIVAAVRPHYPAVNPTVLIGFIEKLCHLIKQDVPSFTVQRQPGNHTHTRRCLNCAAELGEREFEYCFHCDPQEESVRIASELRREHHRQLAGLEREALKLSNLINNVEKAIKP